jgi:hypothetical protein
MATLTNKNEKVVAPFFKNGVTLDFYTLTFPSADLTAMLDSDPTGYPNAPRSPIAVALETVAQRVTIEIISTARFSTNTTLVIGVAAIGGAYPTDDYSGDGSANETMAAYLQALLDDAGTHQGFDLATTTVAAGVRGTAW